MAIQFVGSHGMQFDRIDDRKCFFCGNLVCSLWFGEVARSRSDWMTFCRD